MSRKYLHWICHTDELNGGATRRVRQEKRSLSDTLGEFLQEWIESNQDGTSEDMTRAQKKFKGKGSQVSIGNKGRSPGESGTSQSYGKAAGKNPAAKCKATKTGHPQDKFPHKRVVEAEDKAEDRILARQLIDVLKQCLNKGCSDVQVATTVLGHLQNQGNEHKNQVTQPKAIKTGKELDSFKVFREDVCTREPPE